MSQSRKRTNEQIRRDRELREREIAWEAMMDERIKTESALIRAENDEYKRLSDGNPHGTERDGRHHVWRGDLPGGIDFDR